MNRLRHLFKWGVENELVKPIVFDALRCVAGLRFGKSGAKETEPIKPVADWVVDATLGYCSPQVAAMIQLQRVAGMRSGEVCRVANLERHDGGRTWSQMKLQLESLGYHVDTNGTFSDSGGDASGGDRRKLGHGAFDSSVDDTDARSGSR